MTAFLGWLKELVGLLNTARFIFYGAAGTLVWVPFSMVLHQTVEGPSSAGFRAQLAGDFGAAVDNTLLLVSAAVVIGFLLATACCALIIKPIGERLERRGAELAVRPDSFARNYAELRNEDGENYASWLINEYYRFLEVAVLMPAGALVGLALLCLYALVCVLGAEPAEPGTTDAYLALAILLLALAAFYATWRLWWLPRVVESAIANWRKTKRAVKEGVAEFKAKKSNEGGKGAGSGHAGQAPNAGGG